MAPWEGSVVTSPALADLVVTPIQFVDADGHLVRDLPGITETELARLHRLLLVTRALDQEFVWLQRQGELGVYVRCRGQGAA